MMTWIVCVLVAVAVYSVPAADVSVKKPSAAKTAIDLSGLQVAGDDASRLFGQTLERDLVRSGWFGIAMPGKGLIVLDGTCELRGDALAVRCRVRHVATGREYIDEKYRGSADEARRLAHRVADEIVRAVKDVRGIAATRLALIRRVDGRRGLYVCDIDGFNMVEVTNDGAVCLGPAWTPDGNALFYTSYHRGFPDIYRIDLTSGRRTRVLGFRGLNTGAAVAPDGRSIVATLSKDGNPDLYVMALASPRITRVTATTHAAEASPSWSPDGGRIVFVSDQSGSPQLYVATRAGGERRRITLRGRENVAPDWGPDNRIVYSSRREGHYQICLIDPRTRREEQLTSEDVDYEEPCWAPDGRHIACTRTENHRSDIYILDTQGDPPIRLTTLKGDWYSAAWSSR